MTSLSKLSLASLLALLSTAGVGCSSEAPAPGDDTGASVEPITDVSHTVSKRQSIGNCWAYATASWAEALAKRAGTELNLSESWISYWHWFDQIANGGASTKIQTGGFWSVAVEIWTRYGVISEADFIPSEATEEMSLHQRAAEAAVNEALKSGELSTATARRDRAKVRAALDKAWGLTPEVVAKLDKVFGKGVVRTLDRSTVALTGTGIKRTNQIPVILTSANTHGEVKATLKDAIGTRSGFSGRSGPLAWTGVSYPSDTASRRQVLKRVQRALHDREPVVVSWYVDFNSLDSQGRFFAPPATPGHQGGHLVVLDDYEIDNVPGFGTLPAGVLETRSEALNAALSDQAQIKFLRIKNSWGSAPRPNVPMVAPGEHDLYMAYLNGPIKECDEKEGGGPDLDSCWMDTPLESFVLPAGY